MILNANILGDKQYDTHISIHSPNLGAKLMPTWLLVSKNQILLIIKLEIPKINAASDFDNIFSFWLTYTFQQIDFLDTIC